MSRVSRGLIAGLLMTSGAALVAMPASADDSMQVGNATVSVGGGVARLTLPDIEFTQQSTTPALGTIFKHENEDIAWKYGWALEGVGEVEVDGMFGVNTIGLRGFYADIEDTTTLNCGLNTGPTVCSVANIVDNPNVQNKFGLVDFSGLTPQTAASLRTEREVDHWGIALEGKSGAPDALAITSNSYVALGGDYRTIDQDIRIRGQNGLGVNPTGAIAFNYTEDLDTDYWGAYIAGGADYDLPFFTGLTSGLGLKTSIRGQVGIYYVDSDYTGQYSANGGGLPNGVSGFTDTASLSLSTDDVAVIAGVTLETQLPISKRAALSLKSTYEYYSWVPDMQYNDTDIDNGTVRSGENSGTRIGDDDAFAARTTANLTILLGPDDVMPATPFK
jgi:hypothetical protein